ncbi:MAG: TolC family protein [Deltaproteobacteria bacterium]|nr:TolC family protein [Deltaproteobacteria bacterium]
MLLRRNAGWLFALLVFSSGCTSVVLNAGFDDISATVEERSGIKIFWNNGTELDKQAEEKVRSLLKGKLAVEQAVQVALLNNRKLQAAYSEMGVAQADLVQAGLLRNPVFHAAAFFLQKGGRPELEFGADMNFLEVFYVPLRRRVAAARFEEAKLLVTGAVLDFAGQVRSAFYVHQANEQMLELRQTIVQALTASLEVARRLHEAGNITDLDLARERAQTEASKLALRSAEVAVRQSREQMNALMGLWGKETEWQTGGRLPDIPGEPLRVDRIEPVALSRSIDLSHARQRILVAGEQLGFNRSTALLPELDFGVHGEREEGSWQIGPEIAFPIPLFDQGQARIGRALAELRRAQQEYYALAVGIRSTARAARDRMQGARDRALYYRDILLPLHERIVNESQLQYNAMQLGPIQLLRAREQQIETGIAYIEALRDYWLARADLGQILGGRLPSSNGLKAGQTDGKMRNNNREGH